MDKRLRIFLFCAITLGWASFYTKVFIDGEFRLDFYLPFELCNIMQMVIIYAMVTDRKEMLDTIMYPTILGPIAALLHPFGIASMGKFYLIYFLFYHLTLISVGIYRLIDRKGKVNRKHLTHSILFMIVCAVIAAVVNKTTGGNYMFVSQPIFPTPFNYQLYLVLFTLACVTSFHFIIMLCHLVIKICRSLIEHRKVKYKIKRRSTSI